MQESLKLKESLSVANNACWAIGELAVKVISKLHLSSLSCWKVISELGSCPAMLFIYLHFLIKVRQEVSPVVMTVISCLIPILQHAEVILSRSLYPPVHVYLVCWVFCGLYWLWLFILIANMQELNKSLVENSAITLGRLSWACPEVISPHMEHFMQPWCAALAMWVLTLYKFSLNFYKWQ